MDKDTFSEVLIGLALLSGLIITLIFLAGCDKPKGDGYNAELALYQEESLDEWSTERRELYKIRKQLELLNRQIAQGCNYDNE
jgi:hypothetical protein